MSETARVCLFDTEIAWLCVSGPRDDLLAIALTVVLLIVFGLFLLWASKSKER